MSTFAIKNTHWVQTGYVRTKGTRYPFNSTAFTYNTTFGIEVVHILRPVFNCGITQRSVILNEQFYCACMKIGYIVFRSRTTFDKVYFSTFFYDDHRVFELTSTWCIQTEIGLQWNIHLHACRNIYKGTARPNGTMKSCPFMICRRNQCHPVFFYDFFMFMKCCFNISINYALFYKIFLNAVIYDFGVILGTYACKRCFFCFWNTEAIKCALNIIRYFIPIALHIYFRLYICVNMFHI